MIEQLIEAMQQQRNPDKAIAMSAYMRNQFPFLGIPTPARRFLLSDYKKVALSQTQLLLLAQQLWQLPEREYAYVAIDLLSMHIKRLDAEAIPTLLALVREGAWWDTVDNMASVINRIIRANTTLQVTMDSALLHENLWTRRIAMIHQLGWRDKTDKTRLFAYAEQLAPEKDFFIRKAIGWALRDYARWQPALVIDFVHANQPILSPLTVREALKRLR